MKIFLLGATGRVGQEVLRLALEDKHQVTALVRKPEKITVESNYLIVLQGNALNEEDLTQAMAGADIVISALNTDNNNTLGRSMPLITKVMKNQKIPRIISIGTAGILNSRTASNIYRFQSNDSKRKSTAAAEDHLAAYLSLAETDLDWTIVCPTYLPAGKATGDYRVEKDFLPENGKKISVNDTASFAFSQILATDFLHTRVGIAY